MTAEILYTCDSCGAEGREDYIRNADRNRGYWGNLPPEGWFHLFLHNGNFANEGTETVTPSADLCADCSKSAEKQFGLEPPEVPF